MKGVTIITRAHDAETPYLRSFIKHYQALGCYEIIFITSRANQSEVLKTQLREWDPFVKLITSEAPFSNTMHSEALPSVQSSHILSIDADEYLWVEDLSEILHYDYLEFEWWIAPFPGAPGTKTRAIPDAQVKYAVRTDLVTELQDHTCSTNIGVKPSRSNTPLVHFAYRSKTDLFLKCAAGLYETYQATNASQFSATEWAIQSLPAKYKTAACYAVLAANSAHHAPVFLEIDPIIENQQFKKSPRNESRPALEKAFQNYRDRLCPKELTKAIQKHPKYKTFGRTPHFLLAEIADRLLSPDFDYSTLVRRGRRGAWTRRLRRPW